MPYIYTPDSASPTQGADSATQAPKKKQVFIPSNFGEDFSSNEILPPPAWVFSNTTRASGLAHLQRFSSVVRNEQRQPQSTTDPASLRTQSTMSLLLPLRTPPRRLSPRTASQVAKQAAERCRDKADDDNDALIAELRRETETLRSLYRNSRFHNLVTRIVPSAPRSRRRRQQPSAPTPTPVFQVCEKLFVARRREADEAFIAETERVCQGKKSRFRRVVPRCLLPFCVASSPTTTEQPSEQALVRSCEKFEPRCSEADDAVIAAIQRSPRNAMELEGVRERQREFLATLGSTF